MTYNLFFIKNYNEKIKKIYDMGTMELQLATKVQKIMKFTIRGMNLEIIM